ncbi:MAG: hypothetical protein G01um101429_393 [Parcubacteria group bacterium Gr01-1014_29]|nr:MAG: hypothetical protein G01um101429_393 [Parcubacteria group bacterium Gr01-1014_29]
MKTLKSAIGIVLCFAGGYIGSLLVITIANIFVDKSATEGLGYGVMLYGFLPGMAIAYFILKKYRPDFIGK